MWFWESFSFPSCVMDYVEVWQCVGRAVIGVEREGVGGVRKPYPWFCHQLNSLVIPEDRAETGVCTDHTSPPRWRCQEGQKGTGHVPVGPKYPPFLIQAMLMPNRYLGWGGEDLKAWAQGSSHPILPPSFLTNIKAFPRGHQSWLYRSGALLGWRPEMWSF